MTDRSIDWLIDWLIDWPLCRAVYSRHALVDDGVLTSFTDHQISPLYNHNWHEERRVTRVLQHLPLSVCLTHTHTHTHTHTDRQTYRRTDTQTDRQAHKQLNSTTDNWTLINMSNSYIGVDRNLSWGGTVLDWSKFSLGSNWGTKGADGSGVWGRVSPPTEGCPLPLGKGLRRGQCPFPNFF